MEVADFVLANTKPCPEKKTLHCVNLKANGKKAMHRAFLAEHPGLTVSRTSFRRVCENHELLAGWTCIPHDTEGAHALTRTPASSAAGTTTTFATL